MVDRAVLGGDVLAKEIGLTVEKNAAVMFDGCNGREDCANG